MCLVGLRIDVDTLRGTRTGVPNLIALLRRHRLRGTFFFSVGPDNMGRHLWRLLRPRFLVKMLRTRAASLYGWDILLRGTVGSGPEIGKRCPEAIRAAAEAGHETGLHAWDHHRWQSRIAHMDRRAIAEDIRKGWERLTEITGSPPACFAAPAWQVTPRALDVLERFPFRFRSDCRGRSLFRPVMEGRRYRQIQVPTTLPTYDERIGRSSTPETYNTDLLGLIGPDRLNVLTIHAEAEGIGCLALFAYFLEKAARRGILFVPLGELLHRRPEIAESGIRVGSVPGREGWLACQEATAGHHQSNM